MLVSACALCQQIRKCLLMLDLHNAWLLGKWLIHYVPDYSCMFSYIQVFCLISLFYLYCMHKFMLYSLTHSDSGTGFSEPLSFDPCEILFLMLVCTVIPTSVRWFKGVITRWTSPICTWPAVYQSYCVTLTLNPNPEPKTLLLELSQMLFKCDLHFLHDDNHFWA